MHAHTDRSWPAWCGYRFGVIPLAMFVPLMALVVALTVTHSLNNDVCTMVATLAAGGFFCAWLGGLVPLLRRLGAPAIVAAFLPSYMVYRHWLSPNFEQAVTAFTKQTNFIYLYIAAIIVGSIFGMDRTLLMRGMAKIWAPLLAGSLVAFLLTTAVASSLGIPIIRSVPMLIVPIMAGGVGEGAIPLSLGYAEIFHQSSTDLLSHLLPVVLFANFVAIVLAGCLNLLGQRHPGLTGNGLLQRSGLTLPGITTVKGPPLSEFTKERCLIATLFAVLLYLAGVFAHRFIPLPSPVTMLILAVVFKVSGLIPAWLEESVAMVGRFFAVAVTYPLLFAVAVAMTPWASVKEALQPTELLLITITVLALTVTGFFVGKLLGLFPIEAALVNACHTGSGGTGDVAILTAAERLELMPYAQVATRIGGAITVTLTLLVLRWLMHGH